MKNLANDVQDSLFPKKQIINNITEDYCSFEVSQLILEKGGDFRVQIDKWLGIKNNKITHALAIKWIRENFGIHISIHHWIEQPVGDEIWADTYQAFVNGDAMDVKIFKTHEEAESAALLYTLKHLI